MLLRRSIIFLKAHNLDASLQNAKWLPVVENKLVGRDLAHLIKSTVLKEIVAITYY